MMGIILLETVFKTGEFFQDVALPGIALIFVLILIGNSILNHWGYTLW